MLELFFSEAAIWFTVPALLGTLFFGMKVILLALGLSGHALGDHIDVDPGVDGPIDHVGHTDATDIFKLISIQAVFSFLMGFGWGGLITYNTTDWGVKGSLPVGVLCGLFTWWLLAMLLRSMMELQASGNISIQQTVGLDGVVYVNVPATGKGRGQVRLIVDGRQRIFDAVSVDEPLNSQTRVQVIKVNGDNTVAVARAMA
jgi:hypothetical protein